MCVESLIFKKRTLGNFAHIFYYIILGRYHTITDVYTTALLLTKPSSDDASGFRHGFGAEASYYIILYYFILYCIISYHIILYYNSLICCLFSQALVIT